MKLNVKITQIGVGFLETDKEIVNIDVCNGNWKYNDDMMESDEKIALTINTVNKAHYLHMPVKDAYPLHNHKAFDETREIKVIDALVRPYDNLLTFLNCRLNNVKEDYRKGTYDLLDYADKGGETFMCVLFDDENSRDDVVGDIVYKKDALIEVKIAVIE